MYYFLAALISAVVGVAPLLIAGNKVSAISQAVSTFLVGWGLLYWGVATTVYPLFGMVGIMILIWWIIAALVASVDDVWWTWIFPVGGFVAYILVVIASSGMFRAGDYASMMDTLGVVEERVWTQDIQPKDPAHMRMASEESALYRAQKIVGSGGAIGSQFQLGNMTVQMIGKELWFVAPLDFAGWGVWNNTNGTPGYVKVSAEDPHSDPQLVEFVGGRKMRYTPGAYMGDNLERHLRNNGYLNIGLTETTFEIDDEGNPWWVLTAYKPTIGWWGEKVLGVVVVNPFTGENTFHKMGEVPDWIDRVVPDDFLTNYLSWQGMYKNGWWNTVPFFGAQKDITEPEGALLIYGAGDQPEWVVDVTSNNGNDDSLVGLVYTNSRTGKTIRYQMPGGGTTTAILNAVNHNQDVSYKKLHGAAVQLYNVIGQPTAVVPVLNENHAFQGVAMVLVNDVQSVAFGANPHDALRSFEKLLTENGRRVAVEGDRSVEVVEGVVDIVGREETTGGTVYYLHLAGIPHLFTAGAGSSPKLAVTKEGHRVRMEVFNSARDVVPIHEFDNLSVILSQSPIQKQVDSADRERRSNQEAVQDSKTVLERLKNLSPQELQELSKKVPLKK